MNNLILWRRSRWSLVGLRGNAKMFSIHYDALLSQKHEGGRHRLVCNLPGIHYGKQDELYDNEAAAKAAAEKILKEWLADVLFVVDAESQSMSEKGALHYED